MALTKTPIELSSTPSIVDGGNATAITIDSSEDVTLANNLDITSTLKVSGKTFGFGTTAKTDSHSGWNQFYIGQKGNILSENATGTHGLDGLWLTDNLYVDSDTGSFSNIETNESSAIKLEAGQLHFYSQASGSAGAAVTLDEKFNIDGNGIDFTGNLVTTTGYLQGGTRAERGGALVLRSNYSGDHYLSTQGTNHSSGGWYWGYGLQQDGRGTTTSTFSNFNGERSFVSLFGNRMQFNFAGSSNTAIGSAVTTTEVVRISNAGICFNGDSASANALDDYEEGTWTPSITTSAGSTSASHTVADASYTRIGRLVYISAYLHGIQWADITDGTYVIITGLPFAGDADNYSPPVFGYNNTNIVGGYVENNGNMYLNGTVAGNSAVEFQQQNNDITGNRFMLGVTLNLNV